jgi:hypothetical protein
MVKNFGTAGRRKLIIDGRVGHPCPNKSHLEVGPKFSNGVRLITDFQRVVAGNSYNSGWVGLGKVFRVNTGRLHRNRTEVNNFRTAVVRSSYLVGQQVSDGRGRRTSVATSSGQRPLVLKNNTNKT